MHFPDASDDIGWVAFLQKASCRHIQGSRGCTLCIVYGRDVVWGVVACVCCAGGAAVLPPMPALPSVWEQVQQRVSPAVSFARLYSTSGQGQTCSKQQQQPIGGIWLPSVRLWRITSYICRYTQLWSSGMPWSLQLAKAWRSVRSMRSVVALLMLSAACPCWLHQPVTLAAATGGLCELLLTCS